MSDLRTLSADFSVAPQISIEDVAEAKAAGIWNLFMPPKSAAHHHVDETIEFEGPGLTNLEYALCAEEMGRICRRDFDPPEVTNCRTVTMLHFGERPLYRAVFGLASRPAPPETVSGDACRQFCDSAGRAQMLLCDGMGTGKPGL